MEDEEIMGFGHSGMAATPRENISKIPLDDIEFDKITNLWNDESNQLRRIAEMTLQFDEMILQLAEVKSTTLKARKDRDDYCLALERKYDIQKGAVWDLDMKNKAIIVQKAETIIRDAAGKPINGSTGITG